MSTFMRYLPAILLMLIAAFSSLPFSWSHYVVTAVLAASSAYAGWLGRGGGKPPEATA